MQHSRAEAGGAGMREVLAMLPPGYRVAAPTAQACARSQNATASTQRPGRTPSQSSGKSSASGPSSKKPALDTMRARHLHGGPATEEEG